MNKISILGVFLAFFALAGCSTVTNEYHIPIALSFSDGSKGECEVKNKRQTLIVPIPSTAMVRRSDDNLVLMCKTEDGRKTFFTILSSRSLSANVIANAVFLDLDVAAPITDKHQSYPSSFVIPIAKAKQ